MIKCEACEKYDQLVPGLIRLIIINSWGLIFEGSSYPHFNIIEKGPTNVDPFYIGGEGGIRSREPRRAISLNSMYYSVPGLIRLIVISRLDSFLRVLPTLLFLG